MRWLMATLGLASLVVLAAGVPAVHAQSASVCTFTTHVTINPGVSTTPAAGTFTTGGETGAIECQGSLTGTGTVGYEGTFGDTLAADMCAFGEGSGVFSYTIGDTHVSGSFHFVRAAVAGTFGGPTDDGGAFGGLFEFTPDEGQDCVNVPITGATVDGQLVLAY